MQQIKASLPSTALARQEADRCSPRIMLLLSLSSHRDPEIREAAATYRESLPISELSAKYHSKQEKDKAIRPIPFKCKSKKMISTFQC